MQTAKQILQNLLSEIDEGLIDPKNLCVSFTLPDKENNQGIFYIATTADKHETIALLTCSLHLVMNKGVLD